MSPQQTDDEKNGVPITASQYFLICLIGLIIGAGVILAPRILVPFLSGSFGTETQKSPEALRTPLLLIEADGEGLTYRATSFGIQEGSLIHRAVMAEQPRIIAAYQARAGKSRKSEWLVDVYYSRTAQAGPLTSLLRTDYIEDGSGAAALDFASTFINSLRKTEFSLDKLIVEDIAARQKLDQMLCEAVKTEKIRRTQQAVLDDKLLDCDADHPLSFVSGPPVVFVPSDQPNRLGGLAFYFAPGRIGSPGEGEYIITLPQSGFHDDIVPAYQSLFAGRPPAAS